MPDAPTIADIRCAADILASAGEVSVASALLRILAGDNPHEVFPVMRANAGNDRRDELIRSLRSRHFRRLTDNDASARIARDWQRYTATDAFRSDRDFILSAASAPETIREHFAAIARIPASVPGARQVRRIVGHAALGMANSMLEDWSSKGTMHGAAGSYPRSRKSDG